MAEIIFEGSMATVIGMSIVFLVLALLAFIVSFFKYLNKPEPVASEPLVENVQDVIVDTAPVLIDNAANDQTEIIAVISAAISAYMGSDTGVIASITDITAVDGGCAAVATASKYNSNWKITAIRENHRGLY